MSNGDWVRRSAGVLLVVGCALAGTWLASFIGSSLLGFAKSPVSGVMVAILLGIVIAQLAPRRVADLAPTLRFFTTTVLRLGIVLLGTRLSLVAVSELGLKALPVVLVCIAVALIVVLLVGRAMKLPTELAMLIAVGTSICGVTAIAATAPLIRARALEVSYATGCITLFGMLALLVHPFIAHALFAGRADLAGIFLGTAVHDTAQVAGAAMLYQQQYAAPLALEAATVTQAAAQPVHGAGDPARSGSRRAQFRDTCHRRRERFATAAGAAIRSRLHRHVCPAYGG